MKKIISLFMLLFLGSALGAEPVYKILRESEWQEFSSQGYYSGNSDDRRDGFIHLSPVNQIQRIINKYFPNEKVIYIAKFTQIEFLKKLKWERANSGGLYPHLYNEPLQMNDLDSYEVINK